MTLSFAKIIKENWVTVLFLSLITIVVSLMGAILPAITGNIIDSIQSLDSANTALEISDNTTDLLQNNYNNQIFGMVSVIVAVFIFTFLQQYLAVLLSERVSMNIREKLSEFLSNLSYSQTMDLGSDKLVTNYLSDVSAIRTMVSQIFVLGGSAIVLIIASSIAIFSISSTIGIAILALIPIILLAFFIIFRLLGKLFKSLQNNLDLLNKVISENIISAQLVRVMNIREYEVKKYENANRTSYNLGIQIVGLFSLLIPVISVVSGIAFALVVIIGGDLLINEQISVGEISALSLYTSLLISPVLLLGFIGNLISRGFQSITRINESFSILNEKPVNEGTNQKDGHSLEQIQSITLNNITFKSGAKNLLNKVNMKINSGEKIAIIRPTAAGKSLLFNILLGLISPSSGELRVNNKKLVEKQIAEYHNQIGVVFQDSMIITGSLRENVALGRNVSEEQIINALMQSELWDYVQNMESGLETHISERGQNLSGGQKQRLNLARALASNPSFLFLDDFTSRVDRETESRIMKNIFVQSRNRTLILITQQLIQPELYDQIFLLMEGELIAQGNHAELKQSSVEYNQILNSQSISLEK